MPFDACGAEVYGDWGVRGFFYLLFLLWTFLGVAIVADLFMGAIEMITQATMVKMASTRHRDADDMMNDGCR